MGWCQSGLWIPYVFGGRHRELEISPEAITGGRNDSEGSPDWIFGRSFHTPRVSPLGVIPKKAQEASMRGVQEADI